MVIIVFCARYADRSRYVSSENDRRHRKRRFLIGYIWKKRVGHVFHKVFVAMGKRTSVAWNALQRFFIILPKNPQVKPKRNQNPQQKTMQISPWSHGTICPSKLPGQQTYLTLLSSNYHKQVYGVLFPRFVKKNVITIKISTRKIRIK